MLMHAIKVKSESQNWFKTTIIMDMKFLDECSKQSNLVYTPSSNKDLRPSVVWQTMKKHTWLRFPHFVNPTYTKARIANLTLQLIIITSFTF